jgi:hypothetical protein
MGRICGNDENTRNAYRVLVEKLLVNCPLGRPKRKWEDNYLMDVEDMGCENGR